MDLAVGARNIFIAMEHITKSGEPKVLHKCNYPLTAKGVARKIFTNLAVIYITINGLVVREVVRGLTSEDIRVVTEPKLIITSDLKEIFL